MQRDKDFSDAVIEGDVYMVLIDGPGNIKRCEGGLENLIDADASSITELFKALCIDSKEEALLNDAASACLRGRNPPPVLFKIMTQNREGGWMTARFFPVENGGVVFLMDGDSRPGSRPVPPEVEQLAGVGVIAANAAHEFNNILTSILGWTQIAAMNRDNDDALESALDIIETNARRAKHIAFELLGLSRPSTHEKELISMPHLVDDVLKFLSWRLERSSIEVKRKYEPAGEVEGDRQHLYQTFLNICVNAVEAMNSGGVLTVSVRQNQSMVEVAFADTGPGIDAAVIDRIFDPFFSTKDRSSERGTGGSGLGLSICRRIIEEHDGRIMIESPDQGGSIFRILLPASGDDAAPKTEKIEKPASSAEISGHLSVLVIDDEADIREMLKTALGLKGIDVVTAGNGEEGLDKLKQHSFDVVLLDYQMPGIPAREVVSRSAGMSNAPAFILLSGRADVLEKELPQGVAATLRKPFDIKEIIRTIKDVTDS